MSQILHSSSVKKIITKGLKAECKLLSENNIFPQLKVILVGSDPASLIYTANKKKYCEKIGAICEIVALDEKISEIDFKNIINQINSDDKVHGCIIQLPLPKHLSHIDVGHLVTKEKDVDGFNPENLYALMRNSTDSKNFISCTPKGILTLMQESQINVSGKHVVIIGRSMIVGKPLAMLLTNHNATVTLAHSHTENLRILTKSCDILVSAIGKANFIDETFISPNKNQVIIDVGMNTDTQGQLCGDVCYERVVNLVSAITPVPGGVGPMTIVSLAQNLLQACKNKLSL
jgi:methylenetetrahydrofolate dehydrogenase (NADP+)/methenyltetrahydrofolate cyclohydrolase